MCSASDFPAEGMELTTLLVVGDIDRSRSFYQDVLGATREGAPCEIHACWAWP